MMTPEEMRHEAEKLDAAACADLAQLEAEAASGGRPVDQDEREAITAMRLVAATAYSSAVTLMIVGSLVL
jgi:TPR repeat protein